MSEPSAFSGQLSAAGMGRVGLAARIVAVDRAIERLASGAMDVAAVTLSNGERIMCSATMLPTLREYVADLRLVAGDEGLLV